MIRIFKHYISRWMILLILAETVVFIGSVYAGVAIRFFGFAKADMMHSEESLMPRAMVIAAVMIASMTATGRYQHLMEDGMIGELLKVNLSFVIGSFAMSLLFYLLPDLLLGRGAFGYVLVVALLGVLMVRWILHQYVFDLVMLERRLLVIGTGKAATMITQVPKTKWMDCQIIGYWPIPGQPCLVAPERVIHTTETLLEYVRNQSVYELILSTDTPLSPATAEVVLECKTNGILVLDLIGFFEQELRIIHLELLDYHWWILHSDGLNRGTLRAVFKRVFDLGVSLLLLILTSPMIAASALAIWLESGGREPIFYQQLRVGYGGRLIWIRKIRSMRTDAEQDGVALWATPDDQRITRVGSFIRKTRIDELPQLINVIKGEMSLVGPRPERPEFVSVLKEKIPFYSERLRVKPGITGWAQICYGYGASEQDASAKLLYDLYYVKNNSLFLDLLVLIQSVEVVLFGRGVHSPH